MTISLSSNNPIDESDFEYWIDDHDRWHAEIKRDDIKLSGYILTIEELQSLTALLENECLPYGDEGTKAVVDKIFEYVKEHDG